MGTAVSPSVLIHQQSHEPAHGAIRKHFLLVFFFSSFFCPIFNPPIFPGFSVFCFLLLWVCKVSPAQTFCLFQIRKVPKPNEHIFWLQSGWLILTSAELQKSKCQLYVPAQEKHLEIQMLWGLHQTGLRLHFWIPPLSEKNWSSRCVLEILTVGQGVLSLPFRKERLKSAAECSSLTDKNGSS